MRVRKQPGIKIAHQFYMKLLSLIVAAAFLLSACSAPPVPATSTETELSSDEAIPIDSIVIKKPLPETVTPETIGSPEEESPVVFTYSRALSETIQREFRLTGLVRGNPPLAVIEFAGRGSILGIGEKIEGYTLTAITDYRVVLSRGRQRLSLALSHEG